jgi:hypothetical protein
MQEQRPLNRALVVEVLGLLEVFEARRQLAQPRHRQFLFRLWRGGGCG